MGTNPLHAHQDPGTIGKYALTAVRLLAFLLRVTLCRLRLSRRPFVDKELHMLVERPGLLDDLCLQPPQLALCRPLRALSSVMEGGVVSVCILNLASACHVARTNNKSKINSL